MKDLTEIKDYWEKKYPNVLINVWEAEGKFSGMMHVIGKSANISGDTIGELISQGEDFLRTLR